MPMSATSACAVKPVTTASSTDQTQRRTTRLSMKARSIGVRGSVMSGATGIPSVVAAPSTLRSLGCRILQSCLPGYAPRPCGRLLFEKHWRRTILGTDAVDDLFERVGKAPPFFVRHPIEGDQKPLLCHRRRLVQQSSSGPGKV